MSARFLVRTANDTFACHDVDFLFAHLTRNGWRQCSTIDGIWRVVFDGATVTAGDDGVVTVAGEYAADVLMELARPVEHTPYELVCLTRAYKLLASLVAERRQREAA